MTVLLVALIGIMTLAVVVFWRPRAGVSWRRRPLETDDDLFDLDRPMTETMLASKLDDAMYRAVISQIGVDGEPSPPDGFVVVLHPADWSLIEAIYAEVSSSLVNSVAHRARRKGVTLDVSTFAVQFVVGPEAEAGKPVLEPAWGDARRLAEAARMHYRSEDFQTYTWDSSTDVYDETTAAITAEDEPTIAMTVADAYLEPYDPADLGPLRIAGPGPVTLGRGSEAQLFIDHPDARRWVSKVHCEIGFDPDRHAWWVHDLDSANGTFINDAEVAEADLRNGDVLGLGRSISFVFRTEPS